MCVCAYFFYFWFLDVFHVVFIGPTLVGPFIPLYKNPHFFSHSHLSKKKLTFQ